MAETSVAAPQGITLAVEEHELPSPRARVIIVHGYAEHRGRYADLVSRLAAERFECHLFDLRGHGRSGGVAAHVERFADYVDDLALVVDHVRTRAGTSVPLILIGHSLGGLISLKYVRTRQSAVDALVVSSPFLRPAFEVPLYRRLAAMIATHLAPSMSFDSRLDPKWLSHDKRVVEAYETDPLVHRTTTPRWFIEVQQAQRELAAGAAGIQLPLLMLLGEEDRIADHRLAIEVFERLGSADKTLCRYAGLRHEVFNELARDVVIGDLISWLQTHSS